jgi:phosphoserine aminotransferase
MSTRAYNFNAGPAALPLEVLQQAQQEFVEYQQIGMSIMEISHRSKEYERLNDETQELFKQLYRIPAGYKVLFLQGGASSQFAMIPMNFLQAGKVGSYVMTGSWADKAMKEAKCFGEVHAAASSEDSKFAHIPKSSEIKLHPQSAYLHITSNETIEGSQFQEYPQFSDIPLIADFSSDILSRPVDISRFSLIYAGAQKNLGPSGVTVVILKEEMLTEVSKQVPVIWRYDTHVKNNSLYNTPPVYSIYIMNLVLKWVLNQGGLSDVYQKNLHKSNLIYQAIDQSKGFYRGTVDANSRSIMNITYRLPSEELEDLFIKDSNTLGFIGLKGHRSVGGIRASTYNAVPLASCEALVEFMKDFQNKHH